MIPMFPEGDPASAPIQEILYWQTRTIEMMYKREVLASPSEPMAQTFRETLQFPIYVHSKMIIVDDAYIIFGNANINQRTME